MIKCVPGHSAIAVKVENCTTLTPADRLLGIYLATLAQLFIAALVIVLNNRKQLSPVCLCIGERVQ